MSTYTFLNVFGEPLRLDPFTLDDYVDALRYTEVDFPCELVSEIHIALLKALISAGEPECVVPLPTTRAAKRVNGANGTNGTNGDVTPLPENKVEGADGEDVVMEDVSVGGTTDEGTDVPFMYASLLEFRANAAKPGSVKWTDWRQRIFSGDFASGGWEYATIGVLDELGSSHRLTNVVVDILENVLLDHTKYTRKSVREGYARMNAKFKVKALNLLVQLVCQTSLVREYIEESMSAMTELRKDKVEVQRERKSRLEELATLESELPPQPQPPTRPAPTATTATPPSPPTRPRKNAP